MNKIQYFDLETSINDKRNIKGFILENKIKVVFISDPNINFSSCSIAVGAGYLQDIYPGTAHFLEHLLFMGSEKYPEQNDYHSYVQINGGEDNAFTTDNMTCYYLALETSFLKKGIEMLSWFFRAPLLQDNHINSEMEIIDSEHNKNILSDNWIIDDIFKNFIKNNSKYKKFGTGNFESLKNIKKKDIIDFYNKYYTTDNIFVCVIDSKDLNQMINEYLFYFQEIPIKIIDNNENLNRFKKDQLNLIDNNLIFFNSSSDYKIVNFYLFLDAEETNNIEYQLIQFINYLIGTEYIESLAFYLKENDIIKNISSNIEYFYDFTAVINIQFIMNDNLKDKIIHCYFVILNFIDLIKNISENDFIKLYENYRKIKTLNLLYEPTNDPISISNEVVENMIKGTLNDAIIRNDKVFEYNKFIFEKYIKILINVKIKLTTNINFNNINLSKFIKSKWYLSSYYLDNIDFNKNKLKNEFVNLKFNINNIIGIKNFIIKMNNYNFFIKKNIPELINESDNLKRKIYLIEQNKYNKPIGTITIIRKNMLLLDKANKVIIDIYQGIINKTLNYFLEVMGYYKLNFTISLHREYIIYNFIGIEYELNNFVAQIIKKIHPNILFNNNDKSKKYFYEIIRDMKEYLENFKYNPPYNICSKYMNYLIDNYFLPEEKLNFISNLTWDEFILKIFECLKYSYEYYLMIGIKKNGYGFDIFTQNNFDFKPNYDFYKDQYINNIIDLLELQHNNFLISKNNNIHTNYNNLFKNYIINSFNINPNEINNCIIRYWVCGDEINIIYNIDDINTFSIDTTKKIIKNKLIMGFVATILNEPLFDKIRTIDKLGYIVKVDYKIVYPSNDLMNFLIIFLVQSSYSINRITESIDNFCKFIFKDLKNNIDLYIEKFNSLKESKINELLKPFSDITEELSSYLEAIISKNFIFDIKQLYIDICSQINFFDDIIKVINKIVIKKSKHYDIILNKKN